MTLRPTPDLLGNCGGFKREYGGNLKARVGYCDATSAAVGAGTIVDVVEVDEFKSATVVTLDCGVVVVVESLVAAIATVPDTNETATQKIAKKIRLSLVILFFENTSLF